MGKREEEIKMLCILLINQIYNDFRNIVREELERVGLKEASQ